jgi:ATP-binding protein involved in chromosome partitioning
MVHDVQIEGSSVSIGIALTIAECPMRGQIEEDAVRKVKALRGVTDVSVRTTAMTKQQRADLMSTARFKAREAAEPTQVSPLTRVIAVGSGKGGVGKSTVSTNLAVALAQQGWRVGLLDADIWGFSIPRMLGATDRVEATEDRMMLPIEAYGVKLISTGLIVETEETALMWRGLMLGKALEQFLRQVQWGELDYLIIDLPPGTGDIQMALSRLLPQAEMLVVTTPQKTAQKVAVRVADMARRSFMPVIGVVENMSDFVCEHGTVYELFGSGGGASLAEDLGVPLVASIPLDPALVKGGDEGAPVVAAAPSTSSAHALTGLAKRTTELVPPIVDETCTARIAKVAEALAALPS